jgi:hypothetical protein
MQLLLAVRDDGTNIFRAGEAIEYIPLVKEGSTYTMADRCACPSCNRTYYAVEGVQRPYRTLAILCTCGQNTLPMTTLAWFLHRTFVPLNDPDTKPEEEREDKPLEVVTQS